MFSCEQIWRAIERLARAKGVSMSRLAIQAGLDSTALNLSKRTKADGPLRWPSTRSLSKILAATNTTLREFAAFVDDDQAGEAAKPAAHAAARPPATILLVDDDETIGGLAADILRGAGYRVYVAANHIAALELLDSREPIDLLYTDIVMPAGLGGVALARIAQKRRPGIKVMYTTAYDIPGIGREGGDFVVQKPIESTRLLSAVSRMVAGDTLEVTH